MNVQKILNDAMDAKRAEEMLNSPQMMLGEMILKLEAIRNKKLPVVFDVGRYKPTGLGSWRGSYKELAIQYKDGGGKCYEQPGPDCKRDEFGDHHFHCPCVGTKSFSTTLSKNPTVVDFLEVLKLALGKYFVGYKGGDFTMGKTTPLWVANYGTSSGFKSDEKNGKYSQGVVDIVEGKKRVIIKTEPMEY